ncbi:orotidine-5'-phosphate decarboxylase [Cerasicoccus fimbriatus]|uniref:orotidine-5'-phosphate decarboxylase n=1 Tax=Cerasicoccus fimbriatus TaxID=3014554 RepID=UPI0022B2EEF0|nr:orotidine-5'-phosphate decarboxylase [Cerasicoccus sp. TK19100]
MPKPTELILALDVPDKAAAIEMLDRIGPDLKWVKIGLQLFVKEGPALLDAVAARGQNIFLDLKLHDIPNTVASAIKSLKGKPVGLLTIHGAGSSEMIRYAAEAAAEALPDATVLAVTVLTSMNREQLADIGIDAEPQEQVLRLGKLALAKGAGGLVCSPQELRTLREELGPDAVLVTPGIRPAGADLNDQQRVMTPAQAAELGSSFIVVGRPILKADDPAAAVKAIQAELAQ